MRILLLVSVALLIGSCRMGRNVTYEIPADYTDYMRTQAIALFEQGRELYKIHCSSCHGIFTKGRDNIPNFTKVQFDNYNARFLSGDPSNHAVAQKMSIEQLNAVVMFLRYKKRRGTDSTSSHHHQ